MSPRRDWTESSIPRCSIGGSRLARGLGESPVGYFAHRVFYSRVLLWPRRPVPPAAHGRRARVGRRRPADPPRVAPLAGHGPAGGAEPLQPARGRRDDPVPRAPPAAAAPAAGPPPRPAGDRREGADPGPRGRLNR